MNINGTDVIRNQLGRMSPQERDLSVRIVSDNPYFPNQTLTSTRTSAGYATRSPEGNLVLNSNNQSELREGYIRQKRQRLSNTLTSFIEQDQEVDHLENGRSLHEIPFSERLSMPRRPDYENIVHNINDPDLDFDNQFLSKALESPQFLNTLLYRSALNNNLMTEERKDKIIDAIQETNNTPDLASIYGDFMRCRAHRIRVKFHRLSVGDIHQINNFIPSPLRQISLTHGTDSGF